MTLLIDTNIIIRYLAGDHAEFLAKSTALFEQVEGGDTHIIILDSVVMEAFFVLTKFYQLPKAEVIDDLKTILAFEGVINDDKLQIIETLNLVLYKNIDFVDALLCVKSKLYGLELFSFDERLNKRCA
ncbi:MAG: PIN domain-containing protein [Thiothrix sp.]|uniref:PIN domain-containing protein n=1 Tax=Thiothrix sp. TaxID=1032 RepID=UPI00260979ED|nr:PIN domain-containing protein [Thiothrix sp.]MDD5393268.1 PIN domain-containing protein [Thiothrix sp.]